MAPSPVPSRCQAGRLAERRGPRRRGSRRRWPSAPPPPRTGSPRWGAASSRRCRAPSDALPSVRAMGPRRSAVAISCGVMPASSALPRKPSPSPTPMRQVSGVFPPGTIASKNAGPERHRGHEHAGDAGRDELLRPDHDGVGAAEQEDAGDGERAPVARAMREPDAQAQDDDGASAAARPSGTARPANRNGGRWATPIRIAQIGRAPHRADQQIGDERLAPKTRHVSRAPPGTTPGFSKTRGEDDRGAGAGRRARAP